MVEGYVVGLGLDVVHFLQRQHDPGAGGKRLGHPPAQDAFAPVEQGLEESVAAHQPGGKARKEALARMVSQHAGTLLLFSVLVHRRGGVSQGLLRIAFAHALGRQGLDGLGAMFGVEELADQLLGVHGDLRVR